MCINFNQDLKKFSNILQRPQLVVICHNTMWQKPLLTEDIKLTVLELTST